MYPYMHSKRDFPNWSGSFCSNSDQKSTTSCSHFFNKPKVPESVHSYIVLELHLSESCKNTVNLRALPGFLRFIVVNNKRVRWASPRPKALGLHTCCISSPTLALPLSFSPLQATSSSHKKLAKGREKRKE